MNNNTAPRSIAAYLAALRAALQGEDPALIQDALYDAEEYLRAEVAAHPDKTEADVLELIATTYGAPQEVADAYRDTERKVKTALAPPPRKAASTPFGRFFGVYTDSRAWLALFFMLVSIVTGIFYFTVTVAGLSMSIGMIFLIIGIPFFLLFIGFTRVLALVEGRMVEGLLGTRMPRRPVFHAKDKGLLVRIKEMLVDPRTWLTLLYFVLMLPLGVIYFTVAVTGTALGLGLTAVPFVVALNGLGITDLPIEVAGSTSLTAVKAVLIGMLGVLVTTTLLHVARLVSKLQGGLAKHLLVAQDGKE